MSGCRYSVIRRKPEFLTTTMRTMNPAEHPIYRPFVLAFLAFFIAFLSAFFSVLAKIFNLFFLPIRRSSNNNVVRPSSLAYITSNQRAKRNVLFEILRDALEHARIC
jgi:hypothetical protein